MITGPNVGEPSSKPVMPPPGTLSTAFCTAVFGVAASDMKVVPSMLPSEMPRKATRAASNSGVPSSALTDGIALRSSSRSETPWRRLSREVRKLVRLMKYEPDEATEPATGWLVAGSICGRSKVRSPVISGAPGVPASSWLPWNGLLGSRPCSGRSIAIAA